MSHPLHSCLQPVRQRQQLLFTLRAVAWGALASSLALLLAGVGRWLFDWSIAPGVYVAAALAGPAIGLVIGLIVRRDWRTAALAVDRHYQLKDRALTALEFLRKDQTTPIHALQLDDAVERLSTVNAREVVPFATPRPFAYAVGMLAASLAVLFLTGNTEVVDARPVEANEIIVAAAERAADELQELEEAAREEQDKELEKLVQMLTEKLDEMKLPGVDSREALAKLSEMQAAIQTQQAQYNVGEVDAHLQSIGEALSLAEPLEAAGKALAVGQFDKAADELERADSPPLDRKTEKAVKEKLQAAAKKMSDSGNGALSKAAGEMAEGLGGDDGKFQEGSKRLAGEARKHARRKKINDLLRKQCECLGECKSECEGTNPANGKGKGGKKWGLGASGNELADRTPHLGAKQKDQLKGKHSDTGEVEVETTHSPEGKQEAQRSYRENYAKYRRMSEAVLDSEPIPLGHRQTIRRYFELIRPQEGDAAE
ncbi:MAG: hypothetical protein WD894_03575 [Pirellulales bacterium]